MAVGRDDFLQRFRQLIADLSRVAANDVDQTDGVARGDGGRRGQQREKARHVETGQIACAAAEQCRIDTGEVVANPFIERTTERQEKRVENGAVELRRTVIGDQRIETVGGAGLDLLAIMRGEMAERRSCLAVDISACREPKRQPQLIEIVLVRQRQVLVEPFRRQQLGGAAPLRTAVGKLDPNPDKTLWRLGQRHHAEPERHPQMNVSLIETNLTDGAEGSGHATAALCRGRPRRRKPIISTVPPKCLKSDDISSVMLCPPDGPTASFRRSFPIAR